MELTLSNYYFSQEIGRTQDLAEGGGFEPPVRLKTVQRFSKPPPSATRPPLHKTNQKYLFGASTTVNEASKTKTPLPTELIPVIQRESPSNTTALHTHNPGINLPNFAKQLQDPLRYQEFRG